MVASGFNAAGGVWDAGWLPGTPLWSVGLPCVTPGLKGRPAR